MQPLPRPKRDDVRAAILTSAAETFLEEGFQRASLAIIAQRAGFTKGAVYSNFGSKPELFMEAWQAQVKERHDDVITMLSAMTSTSSFAVVFFLLRKLFIIRNLLNKSVLIPHPDP